MLTQNIELKVKEIKELTRMQEELNGEIEALKDEIKKEMQVREVDELITNEYKIRWTTVNSNRFDSTSFKAKYAELYNQFTKQTTSKRFSIA